MAHLNLENALKALAATVWFWLAPIRPALISVISLPLVDLVLALIVARKSGIPITSSGLKRTTAKLLMYLAATVLAFVVESYLTGPFFPVIHIVTGMVGLTELKSCLEHLDDLGGAPLFSSILKRLAPPNDGDLK